MGWGSLSAVRKSELLLLYGMQNADKYTKVLKQASLPFIDGQNVEVSFQQDDASIHTAQTTKNGFTTTRLTSWIG